jgi:hypothetical protein
MLDWIAAIFELGGAWLVGDKRKIGFVAFMLGNIFWAVLAVKEALWGLLFVACVFFCINIRNYRKWSKDK